MRKILFSLLGLSSLSRLSSAVEVFGPEDATILSSPDSYTDEPGEILIQNHLDDMSDEENRHHRLESARLQVDRLCQSTNTDGDVCTIKDKTIRFTSDLFYQTDKSLVFVNTKIKCLSISYTPCSLHFSLTGPAITYLELDEGASLVGKQVVIDAIDKQVRIKKDSSLWASGQSLAEKGTNTDGAGASYIGQGGYCGDADRQSLPTYGYFHMLPNFSDLTRYDYELGSIGKSRDVETAGGGRVVLIADSVLMEGPGEKIQANGRPYEKFASRRYSLPGGSGGYIYVKTTNNEKENSIDKQSVVSARGGYAIGDAASGSGGVIVFDDGFNMIQKRVKANGGLAADQGQDGCKNGAAGTIYFKEEDALVVDNGKVNATSDTAVEIPSWRQPTNEATSELAQKLIVENSARLIIKGNHNKLTFNHLYVRDSSWLELGQNNDFIHIRLMNAVHISKNSVLDFTQTNFVTMIQKDKHDEIPKDGSTIIGSIRFKGVFGLMGHNITLVGDISVPAEISESRFRESQLIIEADNINLRGTARLQSAFVMLQANNTIDMAEGALVDSHLDNACNILPSGPDMFQCMGTRELPKDHLPIEDVIQAWEDQYTGGNPSGHNRMEYMVNGIYHNYTQYFIAGTELKMTGASIKGPRIGVCALNLTMDNAVIDTSGRGCASDKGHGKGRKEGPCAGSGGAHGGAGGNGGIESSDPEAQDRCKIEYPKPYQFGLDAKFEGSGGASGLEGAELGGAGGGIVRISVNDEIRMTRSAILANGEDGQVAEESAGSGGGAGGTISIKTRKIKGEGDIEAKGGDGSDRGGGGGAGGRLLINYHNGHVSSAQPEQSHYWRGDYSLAAGSAGTIQPGLSYGEAADGTQGVVYAGKCFGGYSGPFCKPCETGTFKYDYSYAVCLPCENKPANAYYTDRGASTSYCPYECSEGLDPFEVNPQCKNALEIQVNRLGGVVSMLFLFACFLVQTLFIWIALIVHSKLIQQTNKQLNSQVYDGVLFNTDSTTDPSEAIVGPRNLKMNDSEIWSHTHRMYLIGENSISFPWYIAKDFPARALDPHNKDKLLRMIKSRQDCIDWTSLQKDTYVIHRLLCPPLANLLHRCFRRRHFTALQDQIYETFENTFWDGRNNGRTLRFSAATTDHQLAYIDFVNLEKSKKDYIGPQLPLTLLLAGSGTFNSPYVCNFEEDPLAKSIVYFHKESLKESLPLWFENLNTLLGKLSFFKLTRQTMRDLAEVIDWVEMANKTLFNPLDTKATLYLFENSYQAVEGGTFKQRRRAFPMESIVFEAFPEMFKSMIKFIQMKLTDRKSEVRLGLVFRPYSQEKRMKLLQRIRTIQNQQSQNDDRMSGHLLESTQQLIFTSDDEDAGQEDEYSYAKLQVKRGSTDKKETLGNIRRGAQLESDSLLVDESNMEASEVYIYGSSLPTQEVKIIDKSKRAFDINSDAVKSLELSLQKKRTSCKYKMARCKGFWYALWTLLFKHHGMPPTRGSKFHYFLGYALCNSIDILLTINFSYHVFQPLDNWKTIGIPFLFIHPAATMLGPVCGIMGCILGMPWFFKMQSSFNANAALVNYPLTMAVMLVNEHEPFYVAILILLWVIKIAISYFGAKVRQHLLNPGYGRNAEKLGDRFRSLVQAHGKLPPRRDASKVLSAAERAANLTKAGPPLLKGEQSAFANDSDEDDEYEGEEPTSFGIIPKIHLPGDAKADERESLTEF